MDKIQVYTPEIEPDAEKIIESKEFKVFLGGTIDNGSSDDWQVKVEEALDKRIGSRGFVVMNPRREHWDSKAGREAILKQIDWEQKCLTASDAIMIVFLDGSQSPISLLELGLFAKTGKVTVFCTDKYYRYDNVEDTCKRYNVKLVNSNDAEDIATEIMRRSYAHMTETYKPE